MEKFFPQSAYNGGGSRACFKPCCIQICSISALAFVSAYSRMHAECTAANIWCGTGEVEGRGSWEEKSWKKESIEWRRIFCTAQITRDHIIYARPHMEARTHTHISTSLSRSMFNTYQFTRAITLAHAFQWGVVYSSFGNASSAIEALAHLRKRQWATCTA